LTLEKTCQRIEVNVLTREEEKERKKEKKKERKEREENK
jgi:hypothetical protein